MNPYASKNDLDPALRIAVTELLTPLLADGIDLGLQAKQAHWNVKGPNFIALHELFDTIATGIGDHVDDIAERIVQLGGVARGTLQQLAACSRMSAYPLEIRAGADHIAALSSALGAFGAPVRAAIETAASLGDTDTSDLLTGISRAIDKFLWLVEAHAQEQR